MWWCSTATAVSIPSAAFAYKYYNDKKNFAKQLNNIHTAKDVFDFIAIFMVHDSTEDTVEKMTNMIISHAHEINESTVKRLSDLSKTYNNNLGAEGYAVTLLWSCIVAATQNEILSFSD